MTRRDYFVCEEVTREVGVLCGVGVEARPRGSVQLHTASRRSRMVAAQGLACP